MDNVVHQMPETFSQDFIETRQRSAGRVRPGDTSFSLRVIGALGAATERTGARVESWANGRGESAPSHRNSALAR